MRKHIRSMLLLGVAVIVLPSACGDAATFPIPATEAVVEVTAALEVPFQIIFDTNEWKPQTPRPLAAGTAARIIYDRERFYSIVDAGYPFGGGYFEAAHHCYGYGCCEVDFPTVMAHFRFADAGSWIHEPIDEQGHVDVVLPGTARHIEFWFDIPGYEIRIWYCGCDPETALSNYNDAEPLWVETQAWDSRHGRNFYVSVEAPPFTTD